MPKVILSAIEHQTSIYILVNRQLHRVLPTLPSFYFLVKRIAWAQLLVAQLTMSENRVVRDELFPRDTFVHQRESRQQLDLAWQFIAEVSNEGDADAELVVIYVGCRCLVRLTINSENSIDHDLGRSRLADPTRDPRKSRHHCQS